jgi:hypothetical protein
MRGFVPRFAAFMICPPPDTGALEKLFRYEVFKMLKSEGKITDVVIENMMNWRHSRFNMYCGNAIWPQNQEGLENLARYITRGASACAARPSLLFSRAHDIHCG